MAIQVQPAEGKHLNWGGPPNKQEEESRRNQLCTYCAELKSTKKQHLAGVIERMGKQLSQYH